jgi:hypothetical protein
MDLRWCAAALLIAASGLLSERSAAAAASARLFYGIGSGVDGCPDEAGLRHAIADRVGYDPVFPIAPNDIEVTIARAGDRLVGDVKFVDRRHALVGGRTFQGRIGRCDDLVATVALSVAIALDQFEKTRALSPADDGPPPATSEAPPVAPDAAPAPEAATPPAVRPAPSGLPVAASPPAALAGAAERSTPSSSAPRFDLAVGMAGWIGTAPSFSLGPTATATVRWKRWVLGVDGSMQLPAGAAVGGLPVGEVRTSLAGGGPVACLAFDPYFACGVAFVGAMHADAPGVPGAGTQTGVDVLAGARAGTAVALGAGLSARVSLDLLANAYSPTVRTAGVDWRPSPVAGGAQVALTWRIP